MDTLMTISHAAIQTGKFCAIVGSSMNIYDIGDTVVKESGRAILPIRFPEDSPQMAEKAMDHIKTETDVFNGSEARVPVEEFWTDVAIKTLRNSSSVRKWDGIMSLPSTATRVTPITSFYSMPSNVSANDVFVTIARTALQEAVVLDLTKDLVDAFVNRLHGSVDIEASRTVGNAGVIHGWDNMQDTIHLPAWRLLQFSAAGRGQLFSHVQNWVLVEARNMVYVHGPGEATKRGKWRPWHFLNYARL